MSAHCVALDEALVAYLDAWGSLHEHVPTHVRSLPGANGSAMRFFLLRFFFFVFFFLVFSCSPMCLGVEFFFKDKNADIY